MVRNAGKFGKAKRGGGRHFSRDLSRLDAQGNPENAGAESSDEESSEEESSEDELDPKNRMGQLPPVEGSDGSGDEEAGGDTAPKGIMANLNSTLSTTALTPADEEAGGASTVTRGKAMTADQIAQARKERKAAAGKKSGKAVVGGKKATGGSGSEDDSAEEAEVNDNKTKNKATKLSDLNAPREMSRREREAAEKIAAKERYMKLHAAGKTDEAKADLGRLAEIRKQREQAAARRKAEQDAKDLASKAALEKSGKRAPLKR